jgi:hypothetical protein
VIDDSLRAVRCASATVAAQSAAGLLKSLAPDELEKTVLICSDDVTAAMIDGHLHSFGRPTMGIPLPSATSETLAALPLAIAASESPADPRFVKELVVRPGLPISGYARFQLLRALDNMPAVGSTEWKRAILAIRKRKNGNRSVDWINAWIPPPTRWCRNRRVTDIPAIRNAVQRVAAWANRRSRSLQRKIRETLERGVTTPADSASLAPPSASHSRERLGMARALGLTASVSAWCL